MSLDGPVPYRNPDGETRYQPRTSKGYRLWADRTWQFDASSRWGEREPLLYRSRKRAIRIAARAEGKWTRRGFVEVSE